MKNHRWEPSAYTAAAAAEIARMADVVRGVDPETRVPTCPEWSVAELVKHTGTVHRWATQMVRDLATERLDTRTLDLGLPDDPLGYADWLARGAAPLASVFGAADPDAPMWAWGADQHARFWFRRMLHETTVHRVDAEIATGRQPRIEKEVAGDAVDELLENLPSAGYFRPRVEELRGDGESIALRSTDSDDSWLIQLARDGFRWERGGAADTVDAAVGVAAPADALTLLLYARAAPHDGRYEVVGDEKVLARWLECSAL
jgi:uncharacterized protein (TIGR03083 family)